MSRLAVGLVCVCALFLWMGCGGDDGGGSGAGAGGDAGGAADDLAKMATPRDSIAHQLALLKAGKTEELKACFTPRLRDKITADAISKGQAEAGSMTLADLFDGMTKGEYQGKETAKIKMKNGRTLTTLILTDGKWLADTIWFR